MNIQKITSFTLGLLMLNTIKEIKPNGVELFKNPNLLLKPSIELSYGTNGFKFGANASLEYNLETSIGDFIPSIGAGLSYYTNFLQLNRKGLETRLSAKLNYENNYLNMGLGTNIWNGTNELKEFSQRTGRFDIDIKLNPQDIISFAYENDGYPLNKLKLNDGNDSFRTSIAKLKYNNVSLLLKLFTGRRDKKTYEFNVEKLLENGNILGDYGEFYKYGIVQEQSNPYRYGGLSILIQELEVPNIKNPINLEIGVNSEWVRHYTQNMMHTVVPQQQFLMTNNKSKIIANLSTYSLLNNTQIEFSSYQ